jgi:hypothetical protein
VRKGDGLLPIVNDEGCDFFCRRHDTLAIIVHGGRGHGVGGCDGGVDC